MGRTKTTWAVGVTPLSAANMNNLESQVIVAKTADETVNNNIVIQNDDELVFTVGANEDWWFILFLRHTSATANPDIDFAFTVPAAGAILLNGYWDATANAEQDGTAEQRIPLTGGIDEWTIWHCLYTGGANAGSVQMQWAQGAAVAEDTKVLEGSFITATQLV